MECTNCNIFLAPDVLYCIQCGTFQATRLKKGQRTWVRPPVHCNICKQMNFYVSRYCTWCGTMITSQNQPEHTIKSAQMEILSLTDERRTLTVLHADISGFTRITEHLPPEHTKTLVGSFFASCAKPIEKYGGSIILYLGDAVLAMFGYPTSHGDDPIRAVEAALEMHEVAKTFSHKFLNINEKFNLRIGIDTGPVVVSHNQIQSQTTLTGSTVTSAMFLERMANTNGTVIGEQTKKLIPKDIQLESFLTKEGKTAYHVLNLNTSKQFFTTVASTQIRVTEDFPSVPEANFHSNSSNNLNNTQNTESSITEKIPTESLFSIVQARMDQLPIEQKQLIKVAAVVGMYFWEELLERLDIKEPENIIKQLISIGLIEHARLPIIETSTEFCFSSSILRQVAYKNTLIKVRRFTHRVVVSWLEEQIQLHEAQKYFIIPILAYHYAAGGDIASAQYILDTVIRSIDIKSQHGIALAKFANKLTQVDLIDQGDASVINALHQSITALRKDIANNNANSQNTRKNGGLLK